MGPHHVAMAIEWTQTDQHTHTARHAGKLAVIHHAGPDLYVATITTETGKTAEGITGPTFDAVADAVEEKVTPKRTAAAEKASE